MEIPCFNKIPDHHQNDRSPDVLRNVNKFDERLHFMGNVEGGLRFLVVYLLSSYKFSEGFQIIKTAQCYLRCP